MEALTLAQLLQAVGGTLISGEADLNQTVTEVCTDSRSVPQGCLFLPLEGERFDGHSFINSALEQGAVGCITARERESYLPGKFYIKVRSTQRALRDLARYYKEMFHIPFVAVTGSVGKTTTKDMVAAVLGAKYKVLKTEGNFNNDIGLPLTLLRLDHTHQICVLEMGMDHAGEIDYLSELVEPDVALITNVGDSHIENLGSRQAIFAAKCEIFNHLKADGTAILNGDDPMLSTLKGKLPQTTYMVGSGEGLDYTAFDIDSDGASHISCQVKTPHSKFQADIPALGTHMIYPTLMATAVGELFGMEADEITRGIRAFLPTKMRMNVVNCPGDVVILNDAYNANPQSMRAAAAVLGDAKDRRRVAVVGDMKELGANSAMFHQAVGGYFAQAGVERLIAIGDLAKHMAQGAVQAGMSQEQVSYFHDLEEAKEALSREIRAGVTILVKASRSMAFEKIVDYLTAQTQK
ncbi:UDP-N-acetylmuramoyl-tripeptide--D-alanyl-D-alanine ligase [Pseudoflavonifractor capillosus]|uniref:UDP-N-acetylmuramoyl-tripeptide--D-alanyl-D- alanine ligase n=1 Tax=Pseudoflavonifractor capillosus TaxID=106588 RepID=UPI00195A7F47|nr:UDP-N-acetylmuramoyl-tripeptide--D-alanyl-D-alanine ligase [Pseudoflavonifractor capillosus]MBM6693162.1 UDP-N-acetylmuramoyl-tripeptide--D-alanyl-D-alanine ligase [Pseudoflavonifractor capillosus]